MGRCKARAAQPPSRRRGRAAARPPCGLRAPRGGEEVCMHAQPGGSACISCQHPPTANIPPGCAAAVSAHLGSTRAGPAHTTPPAAAPTARQSTAPRAAATCRRGAVGSREHGWERSSAAQAARATVGMPRHPQFRRPCSPHFWRPAGRAAGSTSEASTSQRASTLPSGRTAVQRGRGQQGGV